MLRSFQEILARGKSFGKVTISVAAAQDSDVLQAVKAAQDNGLADAILVGDANVIESLAAKTGLSPDTRIVNETDVVKAALTAVSLVRAGEAQVLMKGLINSSDFLRAVLNSEKGLRTGRLLSHLACLEVPGNEKLMFVTDGGMNILPSLGDKKDILMNSVLALHNMGVDCPKVALLTANEMVNPKMPATTNAQTLVQLSVAGELPRCIVEGPIALDVAVNPEAGRHKGITSRIAGQVDIFLVPNIETGNVMGKTLIQFAKAKMAGIVLGAANPIVMTSRAETPEGKLYSMAAACLAADRNP